MRLLPYGMAPLPLARRKGIALGPALCEAFLAHGAAEALAHAEALPPEFAARLAADPDPKVRAARAKVEAALYGRQAQFAADPGAERTALSGRPARKAKSLAVLAVDPDARVREAVARGGAELPEDLLRRLLTDTETAVRTSACRHRPPRDLLARDPSPDVRGKVFARADTPPELRTEIHAWLTAGARRSDEDWENAEEDDLLCEIVLIFLDMELYPWIEDDPVPHATSPSRGMRRAAARSDRLPAALLRRMLADEDPTTRMIALSRTPDVDLATAEDIERRHGRSKFRERPADYFAFPPETLRRFAADPEARMRVLALPDPDLPAALRECMAADEAHAVRRAVAKDPRTAPDILLRLLGDGSEAVVAAAASSPRLQVEAMRAVLDRAAARGAEPPGAGAP